MRGMLEEMGSEKVLRESREAVARTESLETRGTKKPGKMFEEHLGRKDRARKAKFLES